MTGESTGFQASPGTTRQRRYPTHITIPDSDAEPEFTLSSPLPNTASTAYPMTEATPSPFVEQFDQVEGKRKTPPKPRLKQQQSSSPESDNSKLKKNKRPSPPVKRARKQGLAGQRSIEDSFGGMHRCSCGSLVHIDQAIKCTDKDCKTKYFHLSCADIPGSPDAWKCIACRERKIRSRLSENADRHPLITEEEYDLIAGDSLATGFSGGGDVYGLNLLPIGGDLGPTLWRSAKESLSDDNGDVMNIDT